MGNFFKTTKTTKSTPEEENQALLEKEKVTDGEIIAFIVKLTSDHLKQLKQLDLIYKTSAKKKN